MNSFHEFDAAPRNGSQTFTRALTSGHSRRRARVRLISHKQFQIDTTRRRVDQIEAMIADLDRMARSLESEIRAEEDQTGIRDSAHFAYSTCARAATERRDNLNRSADGLKDLLNGAKAALAEALSSAEEAAETQSTVAPAPSATG
jgi:flagellar protein FliJ